MASSSLEFETMLTQAVADASALADFEETADVTRAAQFVTAVKRLILLQPEAVQHGGPTGELLRTNLRSLEPLLKQAREFITAMKFADSQISFVDFQDYRE